jgi:flagellar FliL protein
MSDTQTAAAPAAKSSKGKLFIIVGAIVLLGGGGAGAWYVTRPKADPRQAEAAKPAREVEHGIVTFEPFIVNLADAGGQRFLRADIRLLVGDSAEAGKKVQENKVTVTRLRAGIIDVLTAQTADQIARPEGKAALKKSIAEQASTILHPTEVADVLFSDFVIQY